MLSLIILNFWICLLKTYWKSSSMMTFRYKTIMYTYAKLH